MEGSISYLQQYNYGDLVLSFLIGLPFSICLVESVDSTNITQTYVLECGLSSRVGSRPRRFLLTGHDNGAVQVRLRPINIIYICVYLSDFVRVWGEGGEGSVFFCVHMSEYIYICMREWKDCVYVNV